MADHVSVTCSGVLGILHIHAGTSAYHERCVEDHTGWIITVDHAVQRRLNLDPYAEFSPLDLFRYSAPGVLNRAYGGTPYFSINRGVDKPR